jgi:hypothetical protein
MDSENPISPEEVLAQMVCLSYQVALFFIFADPSFLLYRTRCSLLVCSFLLCVMAFV